MKRALVAVLIVAVALPVAGGAAAQFLLTPDWLKAHLEEAARRGTGRDVTIAGPVGLTWSLTPGITARQVSLANPPGLSRPMMASVDRAEAEIALLPLLSGRVEVRRVVLTGTDLLLERDAAGRPNWSFARPLAPAPVAPQAAPGGARVEWAVGRIEVRDAWIGWRSGADTLHGEVARLDYTPETRGVSGDLRFNGVPLTLGGTAGPIAGVDWPIQLTLVGGGAAASIGGTVAQAAAAVLVPDLAPVSALVGRSLPDLHDVQASAAFSASGIGAVRITAGAGEWHGVRLLRAELSAPGAADPMAAKADLLVGQLPVAVTADFGSPGIALGHGPTPLVVKASAAGATLSGNGSVADLRGTGLQMTVAAEVPDLEKLGAAAGVALPRLRDAAVQARLASMPVGLVVRGLRLTSSGGDIAGDLAVGQVPRPFVRGTLVSQRLDLDAWAPHDVPQPARPSPAAPPASPPPASPPPASPAPEARSASADRLIPDTKLPLAALGRFDADLHLAIAEAVWRGVSYRAVDAPVHVQDGVLRIDPLTLRGPGGLVLARLSVASAQPGVDLTLQAPGLAAGPVLALFGAPGFSAGTIDLDLQLHGTGETPRALAATLDGHVGAAMVDGELDNRWLAGFFADALRAANLPFEASGSSRIRCVALRADASNGQVRLQAITLDTTKLKLDGEGTLNLGNETLNLRLRPQLRLGTFLSVPVHIGGSFRAPKATLEPGGIAPGRVGITIGGPAGPDTCGPALALARGGKAGAPPPAAEPLKPPRPGDLLRSLLR